MFCNYYVLKLLCFATITFSDATIGDINVVLYYVLSQYPGRSSFISGELKARGDSICLCLTGALL